MTLKSDAKFEENLPLGSKSNMKTFVSFNVSSGKSENLHLHVLLLSKVYYVWAKKSTMDLCAITLKNDAKCKEELTCALRNLANLDATLKFCTLMSFFWPKYIMFELKKYWGVMRHYIKDWCKLWRKNDLWFHKWHEEFSEFHQSTQES